MSDWDDRSFDEMREEAIDVSEIAKPDINDYLYDYEPEWLEVWDSAPIEDMTDAQIDAMIDLLSDIDIDEWPDFEDYEAYWEWFRENYE